MNSILVINGLNIYFETFVQYFLKRKETITEWPLQNTL